MKLNETLFFFFLFSVFGIVGCDEKDTQEKEEETILPCNLTSDRWSDYDISNRETVLFDSNVPADFEGTSYVVLNPKDNTNVIFIITGTIPQYYICNFPDYAKKWDIPSEGLPIVISGIAYEHIFPNIDAGGRYIMTCDLELTLVKKH
jgi:hypothetical protein